MSLLAAGAAESPSTMGCPAPGTRLAPGTAQRLASPIPSWGHPWELTAPPKGAGAGRGGQAGLFGAARHGAACAQPAAPTPAQGCFSWPRSGLGEGEWGAGHGAPSGVKAPCCVWEEGRGTVAARREHPALDAPCRAPTPTGASQKGLAVTAVACPQQQQSCLRTGAVGAEQTVFLSFSRHRSSSRDGSDKPSACPHGPMEGTSSHPLYLAFPGAQVGARESGKASHGGTSGSEAGEHRKRGIPVLCPQELASDLLKHLLGVSSAS